MSKRHVLSLVVLIVSACLSIAITPTHAQSLLDSLPNCNFTDAANDDNLLIGAVVYNLQTGRGCAENLDMSFPVASVPKLFVAAALYQTMLESGGVINFETPLTFTERYWMGGRTDCLNAASLNQPVTLGELSDIMISCSDNAATWMIMDAIGWETVDAYTANLGIDGIGQVIPYSEVDRQKLVFLDPRWADVPISMASRFYRSEGTAGLETYFDDMPHYSRRDEIEANALYFDTTDYNNATPRAVADYLLRLAADAPLDTDEGQIARWLFGAMLLTQRQYTAQAMPGTVSVGAKNGFDTGLRAEVNVMFNDLPEQQRNPGAIALVFARQPDITARNVQPPSNSDRGVINTYLLTLSPIISRMLYPDYTPPQLTNTPWLSSVTVNRKALMDSCWRPYEQRGYLLEYRGQLEACWQGQGQSFLGENDSIGVGVVLQNLDGKDTRLTFTFTDSEGVQRSYQTQQFYRDSTAVYWYHPVEDGASGEWTVDVFLNRWRVFTDTITVQAAY